jgi:hypothetical protein
MTVAIRHDEVEVLVIWGEQDKALGTGNLVGLLAHGASAEALADDGRPALAIAQDTEHAPAARRLRGEMP